ncbi:MarR family transcriptional regulator [Conexibacter sp. JD483]|uniref:MarR family transcriptional regulator n=1 Tax=unclassified Conexibacter TaxID=2627773 RepID=UPI00272272CB|nr:MULTISPECIES: MarR family transcriptional regulator [unclassified Conexibacter]MDO8188892.1 MarR family transcriptional regulator [Conexibacter sp. CPCC 205706]MDO8201682.1 MarR family transcriptional regulator [Conexibacter sp. CPCC 205762]MDR9372144.1 MarR family transcriptional regulator [Conexibacter sp. JD483]
MSDAAQAAAEREQEREQLADELRRAVGDLMRAERRLRSRDPGRGDGLSYAQVRALLMLDEQQEATAGQLAKAADLTPASVTAMLDALEQREMIERRRSEEDRRVVVVSLTPAGRELLEVKRTRWRACWRATLADLDARDLAAAADVMRRMARMFDGLASDAAAPPQAPAAQ